MHSGYLYYNASLAFLYMASSAASAATSAVVMVSEQLINAVPSAALPETTAAAAP